MIKDYYRPQAVEDVTPHFDFSSTDAPPHLLAADSRLTQQLESPFELSFSTEPDAETRTASCVVCGTSFSGGKRNYLLKRHMLTHTGDKPFQCPHCTHSSKRKDNLQMHIISRHMPKRQT